MVPIGPRGEKHPSDAMAQAVLMGRIAIGAAEEEYVDTDKRHAGFQGGRSWAESLDADRRKEIDCQAGREAERPLTTFQIQLEEAQ